MVKNGHFHSFSMLNFEKITKAMYGLEGFTRLKHISWATFHANMVTISTKSENPPGHLADPWFLSHF